jgi:hypothetical protein
MSVLSKQAGAPSPVLALHSPTLTPFTKRPQPPSSTLTISGTGLTGSMSSTKRRENPSPAGRVRRLPLPRLLTPSPNSPKPSATPGPPPVRQLRPDHSSDFRRPASGDSMFKVSARGLGVECSLRGVTRAEGPAASTVFANVAAALTLFARPRPRRFEIEKRPPDAACLETLAVDVALTSVGRATATGDVGDVNVGDMGVARVGNGKGVFVFDDALARGEGLEHGGGEAQGTGELRVGVTVPGAGEDRAIREDIDEDLYMGRDAGRVTGDIGGVGGVGTEDIGDNHCLTARHASSKLSSASAGGDPSSTTLT